MPLLRPSQNNIADEWLFSLSNTRGFSALAEHDNIAILLSDTQLHPSPSIKISFHNLPSKHLRFFPQNDSLRPSSLETSSFFPFNISPDALPLPTNHFFLVLLLNHSSLFLLASPYTNSFHFYILFSFLKSSQSFASLHLFSQ